MAATEQIEAMADRIVMLAEAWGREQFRPQLVRYLEAARQESDYAAWAKIARLRAALAHYADEANWSAGKERGWYDRYDAPGDGFDVARTALTDDTDAAPPDADDPTLPPPGVR